LFKHVPQRTSDKQHPFVNKVSDLTDNFAICYYAGGSKQVLGETVHLDTPVSIVVTLTEGQRKRLQQELDSVQAEWDIRHSKINKIRQSLAIEAGVTVRFQLEQQLLAEEAELDKLNTRMQEIERSLESSSVSS
jgi:hypothetical protein